MRSALVVAVAASLAVGCGSAASAPGADERGADVRGTSLRISYWAAGDDETRTTDKPRQWTLRCDPAGGSLPKGGEACRKLKALKQPFAAPRRAVVCTQQYGGPQEALITGTYLGQRVLTKLSLTDGCQISRFKRLAFLVPGFSVGSLDS